MAMKKTSGGDSPLRQGAGKSFWTLPIFGSTAASDRDVFWKSDRVFRFFPSGVFIGEGASSEVVLVGLTDGAVMMVWELLLQSSATATENFYSQVDVGMCSK
jgi:hypothetical protein